MIMVQHTAEGSFTLAGTSPRMGPLQHQVRMMSLGYTCKFTRFTTVMIIYDHIITLSSEISLMWTQKVTPWKVLFMLVRYAASGKAWVSLFYLWVTSIPVSVILCLLWRPPLTTVG